MGAMLTRLVQPCPLKLFMTSCSWDLASEEGKVEMYIKARLVVKTVRLGVVCVIRLDVF